MFTELKTVFDGPNAMLVQRTAQITADRQVITTTLHRDAAAALQPAYRH